MKKLFEFLDEIGLRSIPTIDRRLRDLRKTQLSDVLADYRALAAQRTIAPASPGRLAVALDSWDADVSLDLLRHLAIYVDQIYLPDPILRVSTQILSPYTPPTTDAEARLLADLGAAVRFLLQLRPLADMGALTLGLTDILAEEDPSAICLGHLYRPDGRSPADEDVAASLPPAVLEYGESRIALAPVDFRDGDPRVMEGGKVLPRRLIAMALEGDPSWYVAYYFDLIPEPSQEEDRSVTMVMDPNAVLDEEVFQNWVRSQSIGLLARRFENLKLDLTTAAVARARYLTSLPASKALATAPLAKAHRDRAMETLLKIQLPYFEGATLETVCRARQNESSFERFRCALSKALDEMAELGSGEEFARRREEVLRDLIHAPLAGINETNRRLRRNLLADVGVSIGTLAAATVGAWASTPLTDAAAAAAAILGGREVIKGVKQYAEARDAQRDCPSYFYWEAVGRPKR